MPSATIPSHDCSRPAEKAPVPGGVCALRQRAVPADLGGQELRGRVLVARGDARDVELERLCPLVVPLERPDLGVDLLPGRLECRRREHGVAAHLEPRADEPVHVAGRSVQRVDPECDVLGAGQLGREALEASGHLALADRVREEKEVAPEVRRVRGRTDDDVPVAVDDLATAECEHGEVGAKPQRDDVHGRESAWRG